MTSQTNTTLINTLKTRFASFPQRHADIAWTDVAARLVKNKKALASLLQMEETGGEPDVIGQSPDTGRFVFYDCSAETPKGRRSLCYDREALEARKENKPKGSAVEMAKDMGITILSEDDYRLLQQVGVFDTRTSSWIETPARIRSLGGALFCDRRYDTVFLYHNGAESYYAARGFRGKIEV